jgi:prevent-host-death family protein
VKEIAISKFKATCLGVIEEVRRTRQPIRVTRFGKPVADVLPAIASPEQSWLGCMRGSIEISGDIVGPIGAFDGLKARRS